MSTFSKIQSSDILHLQGVRGLKAFTMRWYPGKAYGIAASNLVSASHLPLCQTIKESYQKRTDPLWWHFSVSKKNGGDKKVVRAWLVRRSRVAFIEALKKNGYSRNGATIRSGQGDLNGSLIMSITSQSCKTKWEDICKEAGILVDAIKLRQEDVKSERAERQAQRVKRSLRNWG